MTDEATETAAPEREDAVETTEAPQAVAQDQTEDADLEQSDAEADGQAVEDEFEDIDYDGKSYKLPKPLKEAVLRHKDYTQKTQEVAEQRRQVEAEKAAHEARAKHFETYQKEYVQLGSIDAELSRYQNVDWARFAQDDPANALAAQARLNQLRDARQGVADSISQKERQAAFETQQETAKQREHANAILRREIPGWGKEMYDKLGSFASSHGYSETEFKGTMDPRDIKILHLAYLGDQLLKKQRAAERRPKPEPEPVTEVGRGGSPVQKSPERMSTEEWMRWRGKQLRHRAS